MVNNKQQTVRFHVDDLMSSHKDASVNDKVEHGFDISNHVDYPITLPFSEKSKLIPK